jgi:hypothetical protein
MRSRAIVFAVLLTSTEGGLLSCSSGNNSNSPPTGDAAADGAVTDASASDVATGDAPVQGGDAAANDAPISDAPISDAAGDRSAQDAAVPSRLLLSYNSYAGEDPGEVVAFDLASSSVAGRFEYTGAGTTYVGTTAPWLLEQGVDVVARLDAAKPWLVDSSWNVAEDIPDVFSNADPQAVIVGAGDKAYVLPYLRNAITVIDTSSAVDGGLPLKTIDLSALVQAGGDGTLEMTAGVYIPSKQRVYILLGNINQNSYNASTGYLTCAGQAAPTVIAIDTTTDSLVALDGGAGGSGVPLPGRNPAFGQGAMAYDAVADRLLVLQGGCTSVTSDGGAGPLVGAEVDELSLDTSATSVLLDLTSQPLPAQLVYIDAQHALIQVGYGPFTTYTWNPTTMTLGAAIPNAPDGFAWDGVGNLLGVTARHDPDSGDVTGYDVVSVTVPAGTVTKLASDPFSLTGGGLTGVQLWPAP